MLNPEAQFFLCYKLTWAIWTGTISHPLSVCVPSSGMSRATRSPSNVIAGAMSYSCLYLLFTTWSKKVNLHLNNARTKFDFTYCKAHFQIFGNHKVTIVPVVSQVFDCVVDLSTVLTRMLIRFHFLCYPNPRKIGSGKYTILAVKDKWPSIYDFKLVWKGFLGTASANKA